jgi:hypothetical protein
MRQRSVGIGGKYHGQQERRQLLEQRSVPEPEGTGPFAHVLMLCLSAFHLSLR